MPLRCRDGVRAPLRKTLDVADTRLDAPLLKDAFGAGLAHRMRKAQD